MIYSPKMKSQIIKESKAILLYYPRLSRMTDGFQTLIELEKLTLEPGSYNYEIPDGYADTYEKRKLEKYAIVKAWQTLADREREIIFYNYFYRNAKNIKEIAYLLNFSGKTIEVNKQQAMVAFAEDYKNGAIIKFLQNTHQD